MVRPGKVVVGFDGSPASMRALWVAVEEARQRYAALDVVYVAEDIAVHAPTAAAGLIVDVDMDRGRVLAEDALTELYGGRPADLPIQVTVSRLPVRYALLNAVSSADLLVVGRSRSGPVHRMISGSVGQYCSAHAPCPVIIVPPPESPRRSYSVRNQRKSIER